MISVAATAAMTRALVAIVLFSVCSASFAYRPFDSTDADVAHPGEAEIEFGPLHWLRQGDKRFLHAPALIANFGLSHEYELVLEGKHEIARDREPDEPRSALVDDAVSIKQVLRRGVLQDESGPSVATEYGLLLPEVHGTPGTGFSLAGIVSQRWQAAAVHLNAAIVRTREHESLAMGVSPRGAQSLFRATQALAAVEGRDFATPDDVKRLVLPVFAHRVVLNARVALGQRTADAAERILNEVLTLVDVPL